MTTGYCRRDVLKLAGIGAGLTAFGGTVAAQSRGGKWLQSGYDAGHTGYNPNTAGPETGVQSAWEFSTFAGAQTNMQPMVDGGTVVVGSTDFNLYAIDRATGETNWSVDLGARIESTPAIRAGTVFVGVEGVLHAFDLSTGTERWTYEHPGDDLGGLAVTYDSGTVFLPGIIALDTEDGSELWNSDDGTGRLGVAVEDGTVYATETGTNRVYAYDAESGSQRWRTRIDGRTAQSVLPVVADGRLVVTTESSSVFALDATTGETLWSFDAGDSNRVGSVPAVHDGTVYYGHSPAEGSESGTVSKARGDVYALDVASGEQLWHVETAGGVEANPIATDKTVYVGTHGEDGGHLYAIERDSGSIRWEYGTRDVVEAHSLAGNALYVVTQDGYLTALKASSTTSSTTASENQPPTARFTFSPTEPGVGEEITFDASQSTDDDEINRYGWKFKLNEDEGVGASGEQASFVYEDPGEYTVGLKVVDDDGATDRTNRTIRVGDGSGSESGTSSSAASGSRDDGSGDQQRRRGFFSNSGDGPAFLESAFNLTVLGFLLSVAGIVHNMVSGR